VGIECHRDSTIHAIHNATAPEANQDIALFLIGRNARDLFHQAQVQKLCWKGELLIPGAAGAGALARATGGSRHISFRVTSVVDPLKKTSFVLRQSPQAFLAQRACSEGEDSSKITELVLVIRRLLPPLIQYIPSIIASLRKVT
jgi:hypothetical protein